MSSFEQRVQESRLKPPVSPEITGQIRDLGWPDLEPQTWERFSDAYEDVIEDRFTDVAKGDPIFAAITVRLLRIEELTNTYSMDDGVLDMYERVGALRAWEETCGSYGFAMHSLGDEDYQRSLLERIKELDRIISDLEGTHSIEVSVQLRHDEVHRLGDIAAREDGNISDIVGVAVQRYLDQS